MKRTLWFLALLAAVWCGAVPALAQDGFYVIGARYTPGTRITSLPYTITAPGYYYLTGNLSYSGGDGITINPEVNNVTIDLMGFVLSGPGAFTGINLSNRTNIQVRNGTITSWEQAVFGGGYNQRAIGVRAVGNRAGIILGFNSLIQGCSASQGSTPGYFALGVQSGAISACTVMNYTQSKPDSGSVYIGSGGGTASDNVVINCAAIGIRTFRSATISHNAVINCSTGIFNYGGGNIVGNAVLANAG